jgi:hypothetical protein
MYPAIARIHNNNVRYALVIVKRKMKNGDCIVRVIEPAVKNEIAGKMRDLVLHHSRLVKCDLKVWETIRRCMSMIDKLGKNAEKIFLALGGSKGVV